ncbi:hypothetical protein ACS0TY_030346 [Phlomoides rotata]
MFSCFRYQLPPPFSLPYHSETNAPSTHLFPDPLLSKLYSFTIIVHLFHPLYPHCCVHLHTQSGDALWLAMVIKVSRISSSPLLSPVQIPLPYPNRNNADIMFCPYQLSEDGHEMQFATNHLGHFYDSNIQHHGKQDGKKREGHRS